MHILLMKVHSLLKIMFLAILYMSLMSKAVEICYLNKWNLLQIVNFYGIYLQTTGHRRLKSL